MRRKLESGVLLADGSAKSTFESDRALVVAAVRFHAEGMFEV
jgi:hypothetical protein